MVIDLPPPCRKKLFNWVEKRAGWWLMLNYSCIRTPQWKLTLSQTIIRNKCEQFWVIVFYRWQLCCSCVYCLLPVFTILQYKCQIVLVRENVFSKHKETEHFHLGKRVRVCYSTVNSNNSSFRVSILSPTRVKPEIFINITGCACPPPLILPIPLPRPLMFEFMIPKHRWAYLCLFSFMDNWVFTLRWIEFDYETAVFSKWQHGWQLHLKVRAFVFT